MEIETLNKHAETEALLKSSKHGLSVGFRENRYVASCYWPNGDLVRGVGCHGFGDTLAEAMEKMGAKLADAMAKGKVLKTAAECKEAVIALIREHEAAPASFRDAVDALPVEKR